MVLTLRHPRGRLAVLHRQAELLLAGAREALLRRHHAACLQGNSDPGLKA